MIGLEAERGVFARRLLVLHLRGGRRGAVRALAAISACVGLAVVPPLPPLKATWLPGLETGRLYVLAI